MCDSRASGFIIREDYVEILRIHSFLLYVGVTFVAQTHCSEVESEIDYVGNVHSGIDDVIRFVSGSCFTVCLFDTVLPEFYFPAFVRVFADAYELFPGTAVLGYGSASESCHHSPVFYGKLVVN